MTCPLSAFTNTTRNSHNFPISTITSHHHLPSLHIIPLRHPSRLKTTPCHHPLSPCTTCHSSLPLHPQSPPTWRSDFFFFFFNIKRVLAKGQQIYVQKKKFPLVARPCKEDSRRNEFNAWFSRLWWLTSYFIDIMYTYTSFFSSGFSFYILILWLFFFLQVDSHFYTCIVMFKGASGHSTPVGDIRITGMAYVKWCAITLTNGVLFIDILQ